MFGHNDDDNNDSQITLPPASDLMQTDNNASSQNNNQNRSQGQGQRQDNDFGANDVVSAPRKTSKNGAPTDELLDIKQDALQALTPLVDHLDQSPEERFRTTMMMIQAADNFSLIKVAYDAAQHIQNEKERAQALLDIVNEINYFTQQQQQQG